MRQRESADTLHHDHALAEVGALRQELFKVRETLAERDRDVRRLKRRIRELEAAQRPADPPRPRALRRVS